jgi:hypothetical protein
MEEKFTQHFLEEQISCKWQVIEFNNKESIDPLELTSSNYNCKGIIFKNCHFYGSFHAIHFNIKAGLYFYNCHFHQLAEFSDLQSDMQMIDQESVNLKFDKVTFEKELLIKECRFDRDLAFKNDCTFNSLVHCEILFSQGTIRFMNSTIKSSLVLEHCYAGL